MSDNNYIISDSGLAKSHDKFGKIITIICIVVIFVLTFLGTMALIA